MLVGFLLLTSLATWGQAPQRRVSLNVADAYAFTPTKQVPALQRLGRFVPGSPGTFVPVTGPSSPAGHVYFVSHGWAPGYLDAVKKFQSEGKFPLAWDPNLKNKDGQPYDRGWFQNVSQSILSTDPGATVFFFSWVDWSATSSFFDPKNAQKNTDMAGDALRAAVSAALSAGFPPERIHLLGHSYGSKVVTVAARSIKPAHLTLFDSPEGGFISIIGAANKLYLPPYLPAIPPSRASGGTFVDNYYSFFGVCYNDRGNTLKPIVDYKLVAQICGKTDIGCKHSYPTVFYPQASAGPDKNLGLWWSPLLGMQFKTLQPDYEQTWKNAQGNPLAFNAGPKCFGNSGQKVSDEPASRSFLERQLFDTSEPPKAALKIQPLPSETLFTEGGTRVADRGAAAILAEPGSSFWHLQFTKESQDDAILIDVQFRQPGGDDVLGFWVDDDLDRVLSGRWVEREGQTTTVNISHLDDGPHLLTVALHSVADDARAEVEVRNLRKVSFIPGEPATSGDGGGGNR
jgi:hypothetical protein